MKKKKLFFVLTPIVLIYTVALSLFVIKESVSFQNDEYFSKLDAEYDCNFLTYSGYGMFRYNQVNYRAKNLFQRSFDSHSEMYIKHISNDYFVYSLSKENTFNLYAESLQGEKLVHSSKYDYKNCSFFDDVLFFENNETFYSYDISNETIDIVSKEECLAQKNQRFIFNWKPNGLNICRNDDHSFKSVTTNDLRKNLVIQGIEEKLKYDFTSHLYFQCAAEYGDDIYITIGIDGHQHCFTIDFDFNSGDFEVCDFFRWDEDAKPTRTYILNNGKSDILDYLCGQHKKEE